MNPNSHQSLSSLSSSLSQNPSLINYQSNLQSSNLKFSVHPKSNFQFYHYLDSPKQSTDIDRFIPSRKNSSINQGFCDQNLDIIKNTQLNSSNYVLQKYKSSILGINYKLNSFRYNNKNPEKSDLFRFSTIFDNFKKQPQIRRKINKFPYRVLDAPHLIDDFYLSLIDWSYQNMLTVSLNNITYLWNSQTKKVTRVYQSNQQISSLAFSPQNPYLAIGVNSGKLIIYDIQKLKKLFQLKDHINNQRIGILNWSNKYLVSGSKDKSIIIYDLRSKNMIIKKLKYHKQEVCGLKVSPDEQQIASGGNDNKIFIWDFRIGNILYKFNQHNAAVKALSWSPHKHGVLVSGGGTKDRTIKLWNSMEGKLLNSIDTESQVCNIVFSKNTNQILSTHGLPHNDLKIWTGSELKFIDSIKGHTSRVLHVALNPTGQCLATGAADETIRFWNLFPKIQNDENESRILEKSDFLLH